MIGHIYIHKNKVNGKCYVGQTIKSNPRKRWGPNGECYAKCPLFWKAIKKYGWDNFEHIILPSEYGNYDELNRAEILMIEEIGSCRNGYNLSAGGLGCSQKQSEEVRKKHSIALMGRRLSEEHKKSLSISQKNSEIAKAKLELMHNTPRSEESLLRSSNSHKGKVCSQETKNKMSMSHKGKRHFGVIPSAETIAKRSKSMLGHTTSMETRAKISAGNKLHNKLKKPSLICSHGHEITESSTYITSRGGKACKECRRIAQKKYKTKIATERIMQDNRK